METIKRIIETKGYKGAKSFKIANYLFRKPTNINTYAECVKIAWQYINNADFEAKSVRVPISVINELLKVGYVTFGYYKMKDNAFRVFRATKNFDLIPTSAHPTKERVSSNLKFYEHNVGWRSCSSDTEYLYLVVDQKP